MINNQNINLTNLSSNKIVIPNNLLHINDQGDRDTMLENNIAERPLLNYEMNPSTYIDEEGIPEPYIPVEVKNEVEWLLKMQDAMFDDIYYKKLNQTNNEILFQQSMINNNEKQNIYTINNDNFSLESNNTSKKENKILNKKKGRKKLNEISNTKRNKFAKDNINKKIKIFFLHCFLSELIQTISKTKNISIIKIKKFNEEIVSQTNITFNIDLFNLTLRELLKTRISKKYKNENIYSSNENEKISNLLEQMNDFKILLDMKLKEIYKIFIKNKEDFNEIMKIKFNIDFHKNFEYYVNSQNDQKYREKLLFYGNNYEKEYLNVKNARKLRKRKNLINN